MGIEQVPCSARSLRSETLSGHVEMRREERLGSLCWPSAGRTARCCSILRPRRRSPAGDHLIAMGEPSHLRKLEQLLTGGSRMKVLTRGANARGGPAHHRGSGAPGVRRLMENAGASRGRIYGARVRSARPAARRDLLRQGQQRRRRTGGGAAARTGRGRVVLAAIRGVTGTQRQPKRVSSWDHPCSSPAKLASAAR